MVKQNMILELSFQFSINIIQLYKEMMVQKEFIISKQLLRSGTSIGANIEEAIAAQSKRDFINKMSIASKEARETRYWLKLLDKSRMIEINMNSYLISIEDIINILTRIVKTAQLNCK